MDIVERMQRDLDIGCSASIGDTKKAIAEIKRLREALRYEENRSNRIGTHGDGCYSWGPSHYECAMREIERLREALQKIAAVDDEKLPTPATQAEGVLWSTLDACVGLARKALGDNE